MCAHVRHCFVTVAIKVASKGKRKAIPLQALTRQEGSRSLRLADFKTVGTWRCQGCQPCAPEFVFQYLVVWSLCLYPNLCLLLVLLCCKDLLQKEGSNTQLIIIRSFHVYTFIGLKEEHCPIMWNPLHQNGKTVSCHVTMLLKFYVYLKAELF
jgi:hypothetical protein